MHLYDINSSIRSLQTELETWADEHDGDITGCTALADIEGLEVDRATKVLSLACLIREQEADLEGFDVEIARLQARRQARANQIARVRGWLALTVQPSERFKDARVTVSMRRSESVQIDVPAEKLPEEFRRVKTTVDADKSAIKEAIKAGAVIDGVRIEERFSVQIK